MAVWSPSRSRSYRSPRPDRWRRPSSARPAPRRAGEHAMVNGEIASVCCRHPDLVAVYEAPDGRLALLLRQTLVPLGEERGRWLNNTRRAAHSAWARQPPAGDTHDCDRAPWMAVAGAWPPEPPDAPLDRRARPAAARAWGAPGGGGPRADGAARLQARPGRPAGRARSLEDVDSTHDRRSPERAGVAGRPAHGGVG